MDTSSGPSSFLAMVGIAAVSSLLSSIVPLFWYRNGVKKSTLHVLLGVSAGILFAISTIDLIPEGIEVSSMDTNKQFKEMQELMAKKEHVHEDSEHKHNHVDNDSGHSEAEHRADFGRIITMVGVGVGFFALVLLEQFMMVMGVGHSHASSVEEKNDHDVESGVNSGSGSGGGGDMGHSHSHSHSHSKKSSSSSGLSESFSLTAFAAIAVHSLVDGVVIGGSFRVSATIGARVAVAIVLHKIPDGFVVASLLAATNRSRKPLWVGILSSITPFGAIMGYALLTGIPTSILGAVLGFAAGTFIFISACGIIPELLHEGDPNKTKGPVAAVIFGYVLILVVNFSLGGHSH